MVEKPFLVDMAVSEIENFTIELCDTIPVQIKQEVGRYLHPDYSRKMICGQCRSSSSNQEPKYIKFEYKGEGSLQNDDEYFQQDVPLENCESKQEVDMDMTNEEVPISEPQEILFLADPSLQTDKEDMRESTNHMVPTEHGGNSSDEENNVEQQEQSPATGRTTRKRKKKNSKEKQTEETSVIDTDQDHPRRYVRTRQKRKVSEEPEKEDAKRKKRARRGKNSEVSSSTHEQDDEQADVYKECPLLVPKRRWSTTQRINLYSKPDVISLIKNTLNERQLDMLRRSCFGNFLDFKITKFSSQLFYHLIRRLCSSKNPNELWFNLEGRVHKFGIKDFALITGMNCGELPTIDMSKIQRAWFSKRYFGGERTIKRTKLPEIFMEMDKGRDKDVVKMAKLYILEMFLLGKQITTGINHEYTLLIDDDEQFEGYPWGRVSYEITIDFVKKAIKSNDASAIGIGGFPYALLVWAYETIPLLSLNSNLFATKISSGMPRMNNWVANVHPEWRDLSEKIFRSDSFDVQPIEATDAELGMRYMSLPVGGIERSKDKSKLPLDQEQNNDARTSYNKDYDDWEGPNFVSNDGVVNFLLTKIVNMEENMEKIAYDIDVMKDLIFKIMENGKRSG